MPIAEVLPLLCTVDGEFSAKKMEGLKTRDWGTEGLRARKSKKVAPGLWDETWGGNFWWLLLIDVGLNVAAGNELKRNVEDDVAGVGGFKDEE